MLTLASAEIPEGQPPAENVNPLGAEQVEVDVGRPPLDGGIAAEHENLPHEVLPDKHPPAAPLAETPLVAGCFDMAPAPPLRLESPLECVCQLSMPQVLSTPDSGGRAVLKC